MPKLRVVWQDRRATRIADHDGATAAAAEVE
jgi:hypothetical protein